MSSFQRNRFLTSSILSHLFQATMMSVVEVPPDKKRNFVSIFDLPAHILQFVCQLLIDHRLRAEYSDDFRESLTDLINLRATCVQFNETINNSVLYLACNITTDWFSSSKDQDLTNFLDFMQRKTLWRFRVVQFESHVLNSENDDLVQMLELYEVLFS